MNFTYRIKWSKTGMSYYGVRYKDGETTESLMTTYFTSSTYVKDYITNNGLPDIKEIRKIFDNKLDAKRWEERVINKGKLYKRPDSWLNRGNNGSFKDIVMNSDIILKIKEGIAKSDKTKKRWYNDGMINRRFKETEQIPDTFIPGRLASAKLQKYFDEMAEHVNARDPEKVKAAGIKVSNKIKGKKKPVGFGEKVSKRLKGVKLPNNCGDNNVSKRADVREKLSKSWEGRETIKWFTNKETGEVKFVYAKDVETVDLSVWENKKPSKGAWYTDGNTKMWKRHGEDITGLTKVGVRTKK